MLRGMCVAVAALGVATFMCQGAQAAVTVLGSGVAHSCYETAEFGGNPREGIETCTEALEQAALTPHDRAATMVNRGILYSRDDDVRSAIADYDRGLAIFPNLAEAYIDRGAALIVLKQYDEALQDLNKGIAMGSNRAQIAYYDRGIVDEALGDIRGAYFDYKKAAEIEPTFTMATDQLTRFKVIHKPANGT